MYKCYFAYHFLFVPDYNALYYFWYYRNRLCHHCHWYSGIYRVYILDQQTQGLQQIYRYVHCCTNLCPIQSIGNRIDYMYILKQGIERCKHWIHVFVTNKKSWYWFDFEKIIHNRKSEMMFLEVMTWYYVQGNLINPTPV